MNWRGKVDSQLRNHLEKQIAESSRHRSAFSTSKNPGNAQLWVAIANLSREIVDLSLKLKYLEGTSKDIMEKQQRVLDQVNQQIVQLQQPIQQGEIPRVEIIVPSEEARRSKVRVKKIKAVRKKAGKRKKK